MPVKSQDKEKYRIIVASNIKRKEKEGEAPHKAWVESKAITDKAIEHMHKRKKK